MEELVGMETEACGQEGPRMGGWDERALLRAEHGSGGWARKWRTGKADAAWRWGPGSVSWGSAWGLSGLAHRRGRYNEMQLSAAKANREADGDDGVCSEQQKVREADWTRPVGGSRR